MIAADSSIFRSVTQLQTVQTFTYCTEFLLDHTVLLLVHTVVYHKNNQDGQKQQWGRGAGKAVGEKGWVIMKIQNRDCATVE